MKKNYYPSVVWLAAICILAIFILHAVGRIPDLKIREANIFMQFMILCGIPLLVLCITYHTGKMKAKGQFCTEKDFAEDMEFTVVFICVNGIHNSSKKNFLYWALFRDQESKTPHRYYFCHHSEIPDGSRCVIENGKLQVVY